MVAAGARADPASLFLLRTRMTARGRDRYRLIKSLRQALKKDVPVATLRRGLLGAGLKKVNVNILKKVTKELYICPG